MAERDVFYEKESTSQRGREKVRMGALSCPMKRKGEDQIRGVRGKNSQSLFSFKRRRRGLEKGNQSTASCRDT